MVVEGETIGKNRGVGGDGVGGAKGGCVGGAVWEEWIMAQVAERAEEARAGENREAANEYISSQAWKRI